MMIAEARKQNGNWNPEIISGFVDRAYLALLPEVYRGSRSLIDRNSLARLFMEQNPAAAQKIGLAAIKRHITMELNRRPAQFPPACIYDGKRGGQNRLYMIVLPAEYQPRLPDLGGKKP